MVTVHEMYPTRLLKVARLGPKAYPVVQRIAEASSRDLRELIGDSDFLKKLEPKRFTDEKFGEPTIRDILSELDKPGRDPRPAFTTATFQEGIEKLSDLEPGMMLEGVVTNVTAFGTFIDIGVHQDGLAHISELADKFVSDPREVVKAGDVVKVRVLDVDLKRNRVALTLKKQSESLPREALWAQGERIKEERAANMGNPGGNKGRAVPKQKEQPKQESAMAAAFANFKR